MERSLDAGQLCVLVIDDDAEVCQLIANILLPEGHQVVTANSAEQGLEQLPYFSFQVAFLDHHLPKMEGLVFGEYLRRNNPHMQIALVTGEPTERIVRSAQEQGIVVITKPFDIGELLDVVERYCEGSRQRHDEARHRRSPHHAPPIAAYHADLAGFFDLPHVPARVEEALVQKLKLAFNHIGSIHRYSERERVAVLGGLMAASVLGIVLPRLSNGETMFEAYDRLMVEHGHRPEFGTSSGDGSTEDRG